jgi:hypothetical protein
MSLFVFIYDVAEGVIGWGPDCMRFHCEIKASDVDGEWQPRMSERLDEEELADWPAGRNAVYQLADDRRAPRGRRRISRA